MMCGVWNCADPIVRFSSLVASTKERLASVTSVLQIGSGTLLHPVAGGSENSPALLTRWHGDVSKGHRRAGAPRTQELNTCAQCTGPCGWV